MNRQLTRSRIPQAPRPPARRAVLGAIAACLVPLVAGAGAYYKTEVVAASGQLTAAGDSLVHIVSAPSINDSGLLAFTASAPSGQSVYVTDGVAAPRNVSLPTRDLLRSYGPPQLTNGTLLAAEDASVTVGSGAFSFVRLWNTDPAAPGGTIVAYGTTVIPGKPFASVLLDAATNNAGQVAYGGFMGQGAALTALCPNTCVATPANALPPAQNNVNARALTTGFRARVADNGRVVVRAGGASTDPIQVLSYDLKTVLATIDLAAVNKAAATTVYASLGMSPAISDDGLVIAFTAQTAFGQGAVFIAVDEGTGYGPPVQVAGSRAGSAAFAELGYGDPAANGTLPALYISAVDLDAPLGVLRQPLGAPGLTDDAVVVTFLGTPSGASRTVTPTGGAKTPLLFSAQRGLWTVRVDFDSPRDGSARSAYTPPHVNSVLPVVQVGDTVQTATGAQVIADLSVNDPIAAAATNLAGGAVRTQRRGDHRIAVRATTASGELVLRASHLDSSQDGLLDHWKEAGGGIDLWRTGKPVLALYDWGARVGQRDLFLQMDWVSPRLAGDGTALGYQVTPRRYVIDCFAQMMGPPPASGVPGLPQCGPGAPALQGDLYGVRSDAQAPADIPAGFVVHVDAGLATDYVYPGQRLSRNAPVAQLQGGQELTMPDGRSHPDVVYFGNPSAKPFNNGVRALSFGVAKESMIRRDPARELVFRYAVFADFQDEQRSAPGYLSVQSVANGVNPKTGAANGSISFNEASTAALKDCCAGSAVLILPPSAAAGTIRRLYTDGVVIEPWPTVGGNITVKTGDRAVLLEGSSGLASAELQEAPSGYFARPGRDVLVTMGGFARIRGLGDVPPRGSRGQVARTVAHELGHTFGLRHGGTDDDTCGDITSTVSPCVAKPTYLSLMNYAYQLARPNADNGVIVDSYAGASDPVFDDWKHLRLDFISNQTRVGNSYNIDANGNSGAIGLTPEFNSAQLEALRGIVDDQAPTTSIVSPANQSSVGIGTALAVTGTATDDHGVATVEVTFDLNGDGLIDPSTEIVTVTPAADGSYRAVFPKAVSGPAGLRVLTAAATDSSNNDGLPASATLSVGTSPPPVSVPNVVGLADAAARSALTGAGLTVGTVTTQASATVPAGQVLSESPAAGASVARGSAVNLVESSGPAPVTVPNVVGLTDAAARSALTGAGLTVGTVTTQASATVPAGQVLSESPAAGSSVTRGSAVNLVESSGPAPVTVPNVVGLNDAAARSALTGAGLTVGTVSTQSSTTVPAGQVLAETPAAGAAVARGSAVNLVESSGPAPVIVPNVVGLTDAAARSALTGAGLTVGTVSRQSSATVPAGQVLSESPAAGASVARGSAVNLVESSGPAPVTVPNVVGLNDAAARSALTGAGLTVGTVSTQSSATAPAGQVLSESPVAGASVSRGTAVSLTESSGPLAGDINGDNAVNCADLGIIRAAFGKRTGDAGFDPRADLNHDGIIDIRDLAAEARIMPTGTTCK